MLDSFIQWLQTPTGWAMLSGVASLVGLLLHGLGYNVPVLSTVLNQYAGTKPLVGGQQNPLPPADTASGVATPTGRKQHPLIDMLRTQLSAVTGFPPAHPGVDLLATALVNAPSGVLSAVPQLAPFVPLVQMVQAAIKPLVPTTVQTTPVAQTVASDPVLAAVQQLVNHTNVTGLADIAPALLQLLGTVEMPAAPAKAA